MIKSFAAAATNTRPKDETGFPLMTSTQKMKLIGTNAAVWSIAILASFILPFVAESFSTGSANFLKVLCFALPLIAGMFISSIVINKSIPVTARD
jgi:hypothetical protein